MLALHFGYREAMMTILDKVDLAYLNKRNRRQFHPPPSRRRDPLAACLEVRFAGLEVGVEIGTASRAGAASNLAQGNGLPAGVIGTNNLAGSLHRGQIK
jgi:hypothetical protein